MTEVDPPLRVLLADDNAVDRIEAKAALLRGSMRRYEIVEEATVAGVLDRCARDPGLDCIVLDFNLADGDALEVLERLPRDNGGETCCAVVILTGSPNAEQSRSVLRAGRTTSSARIG